MAHRDARETTGESPHEKNGRGMVEGGTSRTPEKKKTEKGDNGAANDSVKRKGDALLSHLSSNALCEQHQWFNRDGEKKGEARSRHETCLCIL